MSSQEVRYPTVLEMLMARAEKKVEEQLEEIVESHMMPRYRLFQKVFDGSGRYGAEYCCDHCQINWWKKGSQAFTFWDVVIYECAACGNSVVMHYPIMLDAVKVVRSARYSPLKVESVPDSGDVNKPYVDPVIAYGV